MPSFSRRVRLFFHTMGLSCFGAIFLQILVFTNILHHGYFMAVEQNPITLAFELALTIFAAIYFIYIYEGLMRQMK